MLFPRTLDGFSPLLGTHELDWLVTDILPRPDIVIKPEACIQAHIGVNILALWFLLAQQRRVTD